MIHLTNAELNAFQRLIAKVNGGATKYWLIYQSLADLLRDKYGLSNRLLKAAYKVICDNTAHTNSLRIPGHKWLGISRECVREASFDHALLPTTSQRSLCTA